MSEKQQQDDGGPAFPFGQVSETTGKPINGYHNNGMSLRDYFAAEAMKGLLAGPRGENFSCNHTECISEAYRLADTAIYFRKGGEL